MSYRQALARKWRPAQLSDLVGQQSTARTLANAIRLNRLHHAYLFTGPRGVGKTTIARILAKLLRCTHLTESDGLPRSCDQCGDCRDIARGAHVDVLEIDGASHNGVDSIRELREGAQYLPSSGQRKIYLIDEVHMLTAAAFNALLKTLEEPPESVLFLFATTEIHKVPATILSRVQTFEARRIAPQALAERLAQIAQAEKIPHELSALALIALKASGSARDALSLLDQTAAYAGQEVLSVRHVNESLGLSPQASVLQIITGIVDRKGLSALQPIQACYDRGEDLRSLLQNLIEHLHALLVIQTTPQSSHALALPNWSAEDLSALQNLATRRPAEELELIFQVFHQGLEWVARSPQPKLVLDVLVIKCAAAEVLTQLPEPPRLAPTPPAVPLYQPPPVPPATVTPTPVAEIPDAPLNERLIAFYQTRDPLIASILQHASITLSGPPDGSHQLLIGFPPGDAYFKDQLMNAETFRELQHGTAEFFKQPTSIRIQLESTPRSGESHAEKKRRLDQEERQAIIKRVENLPILREAQALFGGTFGPIHVGPVGSTEK